MFRVMRRPPVPVYHRGCANLPEDYLVISVAAWNVRALNDETDFKLTNLLNDMERLPMDISGVSEHTGQTRQQKLDYIFKLIIY